MTREYESCVFCPKMCRHVCPVATFTGREAATPTAMMTAPWALKRSLIDEKMAREIAGLCAECGACERFCKLEIPVPSLLKRFRLSNKNMTLPSLPDIQGSGSFVAVAPDQRDWSAALESFMEKPVSIAYDSSDLGHEALEHKTLEKAHLKQLRRWAKERQFVVADDLSKETLLAANISVVHLSDLLKDEDLDLQGCGNYTRGNTDQLLCCGSRMRRRQTKIADGLAKEMARSLPTASRIRNVRCANHLRSQGIDVEDPIDRLMERK